MRRRDLPSADPRLAAQTQLASAPLPLPSLPSSDLDRSFAFSVSAQMLQSLLGSKLFRFLFCSTFGPGHIFRLALPLDIDSCFHSECLAMARPLFLHCDIDG